MDFRFWLAQNFNQMARWFPRNLRQEFGEELEEVLSERMADAAARGWLPLLRLALHELLQLPGLHIREKSRSKVLGGGLAMLKPSMFDDMKEPTPWGWSLLGLIPFLFGPIGWMFQQVFLLVNAIQTLPTGPFAIQPLIYAYVIMILIICAILVAAWIKGFPAWSYGLGMTFILVCLYLMNVRIPGLTIFGLNLGRNVMGWLAWVPLAVIILPALIITRKNLDRPFATGARALRDDFTRVSFGLFAFTPFIMFLIFDEVHGEEPFLLLSSLFLGGCALVYLRARRVALGVGAMLGGMVLAYAVSAVYLGLYWEGHMEPWMQSPGDGWSSMLGTLTCAIPVIILTLGPWLIYRIGKRRVG